MRKENHLLVALILVAAFCACARNAGPVTGEWGKPVEGVQAALRVQNASLISGDPIPLMVVFRNVGKAPRTVSSSPYVSTSLFHDGKPYGDHIGNITLSKDEITIPAGEEREFEFKSYRTDHQGAGKYEFSGKIGNMEVGKFVVDVK